MPSWGWPRMVCATVSPAEPTPTIRTRSCDWRHHHRVVVLAKKPEGSPQPAQHYSVPAQSITMIERGTGSQL